MDIDSDPNKDGAPDNDALIKENDALKVAVKGWRKVVEGYQALNDRLAGINEQLLTTLVQAQKNNAFLQEHIEARAHAEDDEHATAIAELHERAEAITATLAIYTSDA